jgi:hypothetical protein
MNDLTPHARGLLLWALYHHQGRTSTIGVPIRQALGVRGELTPAQLREAREAVAAMLGIPPAELHRIAEAMEAVATS